MSFNSIMKIFLLLFCIQISFLQIIDLENLNLSDVELWQEFLQKYAQEYTPEELKFRFQVFLKNIRLLTDEPTLKSRTGEVLLGAPRFKKVKRYIKAINQFATLTEEEFAKFYLNPYLDLKNFKESPSMIYND